SAALVSSRTTDDLLLHLIATHHGTARPFAGPVDENEDAPTPFTAALFGSRFQIESAAQDAASWNGPLPERFWRVVRQYGWWGTAYRETVFRLADHAQSRKEQESGVDTFVPKTAPPHGWPAMSATPELVPLQLTGLDGSNPLAFLAAVGTLRLAAQAFDGRARMSWVQAGRWIPLLHAPGGITADDLQNRLLPLCSPSDREPIRFSADLKIPRLQ